jgi:hypothetical protein
LAHLRRGKALKKHFLRLNQAKIRFRPLSNLGRGKALRSGPGKHFNRDALLQNGAAMVSIRNIFAGAALTLAATGGSAMAARPAPTTAPAVQAVVDCRKIDDSAQRLACYDAATDALTKAQATGDLITLDREQRRAVRKQAFGFTLPSLAMFDVGEKSEEADSIEETAASARQDGQGRWTVVMQDGAVWRQIDDEFLSRDPHPGSAIVIRRAMMGSFMMSVDKQPGIRAHRDN